MKKKMGFKIITFVILLIVFFVSLSSAISDSIVDLGAQGGYITSIEISAVSSNSNYWQGYYGVITTESSPVYGDSFNASAPAPSTIQKLEFGANVREGDYLLITSSPFPPSISELRPGNVSKIDFITGSGSDSGTNTFTNNSTYKITGRDDILTNVPTLYTFVNNTPQSQKFKEGLLEDASGNLVFAVPVSKDPEIGYDNEQYYFQFILPNNNTNPLTYYMYYLPYSAPVSLDTSGGINIRSNAFDVLFVQYNENTKQLEVIYSNSAHIGLFFKSNIDVFVNGVKIATVGDPVISYIQSRHAAKITYYVDLMDYTDDSDIKVEISSDYGRTISSMNMLMTKGFDVTISYPQTNCAMELLDVIYDPITHVFTMELMNTGQVTCYASSTIISFINNSKVTLDIGNPVWLSAGDSIIISENIPFTKEDMIDNPTIFLRIKYGDNPERLLETIDYFTTIKDIQPIVDNATDDIFSGYQNPVTVFLKHPILGITTFLSIIIAMGYFILGKTK